MTYKKLEGFLDKTTEEICVEIKKLCDGMCYEHNESFEFEDEEFREIVDKRYDDLCNRVRTIKKIAMVYVSSYQDLKDAADNFMATLNCIKDIDE